MGSNTTQSPVFLVLPPEVTDLKYQPTELRGRIYEHQDSIQKLFTARLSILGATQIVLGILNFSFGIVFLFTLVKPYPRFPFILITGYPFWGSALYIASGAFLIALQRKTTGTMVRASCLMSLLSMLGAVVGIILLVIGFFLDKSYICGYVKNLAPCSEVTFIFMSVSPPPCPSTVMFPPDHIPH
ncbi:PREDICTED: membrane-spanning 4-domains subfamily A member 5 isoform X2 [Chinchilla lanigera]|uniref:membrane-spanning 4-domains subfamily A member 5 isoform X2 n=1 Tax=Chinchilla lanigera TaxID=34839 RepID=UPI00038EE522|nr:PREDICTED: membrane-spanning 4-domains subfamily A member 5 isoform X2 [Chinchilla lanigera]